MSSSAASAAPGSPPPISDPLPSKKAKKERCCSPECQKTAIQVTLVVGLIFLAFATLFATNVFPAAVLGGVFNCCCIAIGAGLLSIIMGILLCKCNTTAEEAPKGDPRVRKRVPEPEDSESNDPAPDMGTAGEKKT